MALNVLAPMLADVRCLALVCTVVTLRKDAEEVAVRAFCPTELQARVQVDDGAVEYAAELESVGATGETCSINRYPLRNVLNSSRC